MLMHEYARSRCQAHLMSYDRSPCLRHPVAHSRARDNGPPLVSVEMIFNRCAKL